MNRRTAARGLGTVLVIFALQNMAAAQFSGVGQCEELCTDDCQAPARARRVVVIGSSTAAGAGAPSIAKSWVGRLTNAVSGKGFAVVNVSISGTKTADSLDRFDRNVLPLSPDFVVLATSIMNESGFSDFPSLRRTYVQNTRRLITRVQEIGAIPVLTTPYPSNGLNPALRQQMLEISREFEAEGVTVWDFWNAEDDGTGRWLPGLSSDGIHVGDTGHLNLFETIPLGFFDYALNANRPLPPRQGFGSWGADGGEGNKSAISVSPASPAPSWSAAFWTSAGGEDQEKTLLEIAGPEVRVRRMGMQFELLMGDQVVVAGAASERGGFQHLCLTYQKLTGSMTLYVNGVAAGSANVGDMESARLFTLGTAGERPGIQGDSVAQWLIYRTPLCAEDVQELAAGRVPVKSMEAHLPLNQSPARRNQNAAPTAVEILIGGAWHWVPEGPLPMAIP